METTPPDEIDGPHHSTADDDQVCCPHHDLESLCRSNESLRLETVALEESLRLLRSEFSELKRERDSFEEKLEEELREKEEIRIELQVYKEKKIEALEFEKGESDDLLVKISNSIDLVKENLWGILDSLDDERVTERESNKVEDLMSIHEAIKGIEGLVKEVELGVIEVNEARKKEKKELEKSVVSLTEENRDINSLLRIALVEKEAVERSLNRLRGNTEQKRVPLLQRVGFGFMMGSGSNDQAGETSASNASNKSDSSDCEEEVVSLVCLFCLIKIFIDWFVLM